MLQINAILQQGENQHFLVPACTAVQDLVSYFLLLFVFCFFFQPKSMDTFLISSKNIYCGSSQHVFVEKNIFLIAPDKRGYQVNIFLISPQKHMLWVLVRSALLRCF